jgi:hypothetical protein
MDRRNAKVSVSPGESGMTAYRLRFLGLAVTSNCVMQAVLAFSTAILAWETNSEETRSLGTKYSLNAHSLLSEASNNSDALLAALVLLSWIETTWYVIRSRVTELPVTIHQGSMVSPYESSEQGLYYCT